MRSSLVIGLSLAAGIAIGVLMAPIAPPRVIAPPVAMSAATPEAPAPSAALDALSDIRHASLQECHWLCENWSGDPALLHLAVAKFAATDPIAAFEWAKTQRDKIITIVFAEWAKQDKKAALAAAADIRKTLGESRGNAVFAGIADGIAETNIPAALTILRDHCRDGCLFANVLARAVEADPAMVTRFTQSIMSADVQVDVVNRVLETWSAKDPPAAIAWAQEHFTGNTHYAADVIRHWTLRDRDAAKEFAFGFEGDLRDELISGWISTTATRLASESLSTLIATLPPASREDCLRHLVAELPGGRIASVLDAAGIDFLDGNYNYAIARISQSIGDLDARIAWGESLPEGAPRTAALTGAMAKLSSTDPARALAYISKASDYSIFKEVRISDLTKVDPEATIAFVEANEEEYYRNRWRKNVIETLVPNDPQRAWSYVESAGAKPEDRQELAGKWATAAIRATPGTVGDIAEWSLAQDDENLRRGATGSSVYQWAKKDVTAAAAWVGELPPSPTRDSAVANLSSALANTDAEAAYEWAATIADPKLRSEFTQKPYVNWEDLDPQRAKARKAELALQPEP